MMVHGTNVSNSCTEMKNTCMRVQCEDDQTENMNSVRKHFDLQNLIMQDRGQDMDLKNDVEIKKFG